ncbi:UvrD/REP helicase [Nitratireductor aquibiodomus RA22]|uniref:DNA 3'-5' helicase n=1 Tax=Nitratireductor aquibiodomus RA22 TaxID=1189611 RepID=I5BT42_9HYPH|nr:ATP-dependent helicase [Nitratireductor aquibiodomus]EIM72744.1 UvrD/REP helicase [Nitratireductor aquibiodomus RA22]
MEGFDTVRAVARRAHDDAAMKANGERSASKLLEGATRLTGIPRQGVQDGDPVLCGAEAILDPQTPAIFYKQSVPEEKAAFYQAHEFGHHFLDNASGACSAADIDDIMPEERMPLGVQRVEGYGPRERRECQANVFAREFLLPCSEARRLFIAERLPATSIAEQRGLPLGLVYQQLAQALFVPEFEAAPVQTHKAPALDNSQRVAAEAMDAPHLVEAGPGTGKTRTLIARIDWLLHKKEVPPENILALTFSNKAAEEMRERVALSAPDAAPAIWAGTFHAFGLEVLRKYGHLLGLDPNVQPVDPSDALLLLEERLPELPLDHYLKLYDPALALRDVLSAISRAKDELIGPAQYRGFGEAMLNEAGHDADAREAAQKVIEVADIYAVYEQILQDAGVVDFADLILKPIKLLEEHPEVGPALRGQYPHILVDEYQDVNRASSVLLQLLAAGSKELWVVGDARQSIYRFRGASPANIRNFERDFPGGKRLSLDVNYRSQDPVVRFVEAFAPKMKASVGGLPGKWTAHRGHQGGEICMEIAVDLPAEATGLAAEIEKRRKDGVPYRDQAILCRSHTNLARFAGQLEARGIPVLYLGDLFERPEIRDMLALLSFTCEPERGGLLRIASFPEYSLPLDDVREVLSFAKEKRIYPLDAISRLSEIAGLSSQGRAGLGKLADHLSFVTPGTTPGALLAEYLFVRSGYLDSVLADESVSGQQQRLALFQLLQFAIEHKGVGGGGLRNQLLQWIRRLEIFGEERQMRQMPSAAAGIDAVRLLTVHASKGLEFSVVYLPGLGTSMFPVNPQYNPCPPPPSMLSDDPKASHAEEEECLFFVAASRARDTLHLSRAERYGANRNASSLLTAMAAHLPRQPDGPPRWRDGGDIGEKGIESHVHLAPELDSHRAEDLDQYLRCPRAYLYQRVLALSGARDDNAYVEFHRAVYSVLRWMSTQEAGREIGREEAFGMLETAWEEIGPSKHPYAAVYREAADGIIGRAITRRSSGAEILDADWQLVRPNGRIRVRPDHVENGPEKPIVRRLRTGKPPKKVDDDLYALYHAAAAQELGEAKVEALFLTTDEVVPVPMSEKVIGNRLQKYDNAIAGIRSGHFPASPDERTCPRCPQYFICPGVPGESSEF